tara:strand:- start:271 stop:531 length:261 start_codon:yes stop_codon:yes gene_type:complete
MKLLKTIFNQLGFIDSVQLAEFVESFPNTQVVIRWGGLPRERARAVDVSTRIAQVEDSNTDYVRDVFIDTKTMASLRIALGEDPLF